MTFPDADPRYFPPRELKRVFATGEVLFLLDPARLAELGGTPLLRSLANPVRHGADPSALTQGVVVPAIGLEPGFFTVLVRSTGTDTAMLPLSHLVFSTGFVLGTVTGELELWSGDHLALDSRQLPRRPVQVSPGWYRVTVAAGIRLDGEGAETEESICCFLLDPTPTQPEFAGDITQTLGFFG
jgi:hypothetical protein